MNDTARTLRRVADDIEVRESKRRVADLLRRLAEKISPDETFVSVQAELHVAPFRVTTMTLNEPVTGVRLYARKTALDAEIAAVSKARR